MGQAITREWGHPSLFLAHKMAPNKKNQQKTSRYKEAHKLERREHEGGLQEARELIHDPPRDRQIQGYSSRPSGDAGSLRKWWRMEGTKKGAPTGFERDVGNVDGG